MTKRIYLAVLFLGAFTATSVHANYDRLRESLEPVSNCQGVVGAIVHEAVYVNVYCPEHGVNGELVWVAKGVFIDLVARDVKEVDGRFELLGSNNTNNE